MKILSFIYLIANCCVCESLMPSEMPSGKGRRYIPTKHNLETDLQPLTGAEASFVSKHWLNNILQSKRVCEEDKVIIEKINSLETYIQTRFSDEGPNMGTYLAWIPNGYTKDILFIAVLDITEDEHIVKLLINSPFWESAQIDNRFLLGSLEDFSIKSNKKLEMESFLNENIRYKLEWRCLYDANDAPT